LSAGVIGGRILIMKIKIWWLSLVAALAFLALGFAGFSVSPRMARDKGGFLREDALRARTRASYSFASELVGIESPDFLDAFMRSYNAAVDLENNQGRSANLGKWNLDSKLLGERNFRKGQVSILVDSSKYPDQLPAPEIEECAALMRGGTVCCSGIVIDRSAILTAGHCLAECSEVVRLETQAGAPVTVSVDKDSSAVLPGVDLAVIKLKQNVSFPIASLASDSEMAKFDNILAAGYGAAGPHCSGRKGIRRKAFLPVAAELCDGPSMNKYGCKVGEFVAGSAQSGICPADSGGAGFIVNGRNRVLAGVIVEKVPGAELIGRFVRMDKGVRDLIADNL
jgi:hypothetical protein